MNRFENIQQHFYSFYNTLPFPVVLIDGRARVAAANNAFAELVSHDPVP